MAFEQMTLSDWMEIKEKIRKDLLNVKHAFVRVGYHLRRIRDEEMYKQDGYASIADFAKEEYGLEASTVSRLISINEKFSVDGYSEQLLPQYEDFKQASLTEMLALPASDLSMITPDTSREEIRDLKRFNKTASGTDDFYQVVEEFCRQNRELINDLYTGDLISAEEKDLAEAVNPSGSRTFKKGLYFVSFTDSAVKVKKFGGTPMDLTYKDFIGWIKLVIGEDQKENAWEAYFGYPEGEEAAIDKEEPAAVVRPDIMPVPEEIAPAQLSPETPINTECETDSEGEKREENEEGKEGEEGQDPEDDVRDTAGASAEADEGGDKPEGSHEDDAAVMRSERGDAPGSGGLQAEAERDPEAAGEPEPADYQEQPAEKEESEPEIESQKDVIAPAQKTQETLKTLGAEGSGKEYLKSEILRLIDCLKQEAEADMWLTARTRIDTLAICIRRIQEL